MAIVWGGASGHLQVGIDAWTSTPSHASTSVTVYLRVYVRVADSNWDYDDTESFSVSGTGGGGGSFHNGLSGTGSQMTIWSNQWSQGISYSGGGTLSWTARVTGMYNGGSPSVSRSLTLPARPASTPAAPGGVVATNIQATQATLSWNAASDEGAAIDNYQAHISVNTNFSPTLYGVTGSGSVRSYTYTGLAKGTTYHTKVQAHNRLGWGSLSPLGSFTTGTTAPSAPGDPSISGITATAATVSWTAPSDSGGTPITGYEVDRASDANFTDILGTTRLAGTSVQWTGLSKGTKLYVRVRAINAVGASAESHTTSFTTLSTVASPPLDPSISNVQPTQMDLSWTAPSDDGGTPVIEYEVQWARDPSFTGAASQRVSGLSATLTGLIPGTTYYVRVRGNNAAGLGAWSAVATSLTLSGVRVGNGTGWTNAVVHVGDGARWVVCQVLVGDGGGWT